MSDIIPQQLQDALAGHYALERVVGRGGMAVVYRAQDLRHNRPVALKLLHEELSATLGAERFQREIQIAARLQHPHILMLIEAGQAAGRLYYVMPYVEGESLRQRLIRQRSLPPDEVLALVYEVAGALDYAHRQGVIHRDIKPENILLSAGHALVADFGIAKAVTTATDQAITRTGFPVGTVGYMSPEQAAGLSDLSPRTDVYSLAATTFEMLVGDLPGMWPGEDSARLRQFVDASPRHRAALDQLPGAVEAVLVQGLLLREQQRTATPGEFARGLGEALGPTPRFSTTAADQILARAAELDATTPTTDSALSLGGLQRIAGEVGIAPAHVERAARELATHTRPVPVHPFIGSPTRIVLERVARREFGEGDTAELVDLIRQTVGNIGQVSRLGRELTWQTVAYGGTPARQLFITLRPGGGQTVIRFEENLKQVAGQYFGGLMGGFGGGTMGIWIGVGMGVFHSPAVAIGLALTSIGSTYALARRLFWKQVTNRTGELEGLGNRLVGYLEDPGRQDIEEDLPHLIPSAARDSVGCCVPFEPLQHGGRGSLGRCAPSG